ncbi:MAG: hypothetical protein M1286_03285 [Candidatus Marsarchaeota archaeon]|nr:hypothetical protein [Candidatus Marsarchaeota archaeon]
MRFFRSQSAIEYLVTYGWAILAVVIVLAALYSLNIFNPGSVLPSQCILPAGLSCTSVSIASNGLAQINLLQATLTPINLTAYGCNLNSTVAHMQIPLNPPTNQIRMQIGGNYSFTVQCYGGNSAYSAVPGTPFQGYLSINYTESTSGFPHVVIGRLTGKLS